MIVKCDFVQKHVQNLSFYCSTLTNIFCPINSWSAYHLHKPPGWKYCAWSKTIKFGVVRERPATNYILIRWTDYKEVEKLHRLKSQPIFSAAFQTEWRIPFDFPSEIFGFSMWMVRTPTNVYLLFSQLYSCHAVLKTTTSESEGYRIHYYWHPSQIIITMLS